MQAFASLLQIDPDLIRAAAENSAGMESDLSLGAVRVAIAEIPDEDKTRLLHRVYDGDAHVSMELCKHIRKMVSFKSEEAFAKRRSVLDLRLSVQSIRKARKAAICTKMKRGR